MKGLRSAALLAMVLALPGGALAQGGSGDLEIQVVHICELLETFLSPDRAKKSATMK